MPDTPADLDRQLALVPQQTVHGVLLADTRGRTLWMNAGFSKMCGYTLDEMLGQAPGRFLQGPDTDPDTVAYMGDRLAQREAFVVDVLNYAKGGRAYWARMDINPLFDGDEWLGWAAVETDVTQERQATERLRDALDRERELNEMKSQFVSMVSHEFRTPLSTIQSSAELVGRYGPGDGERVAKHVERIGRSVGHLTRLLEDVVALNEAEGANGAPTLRAEPLDVAAFVADLAEEVQDGVGRGHRVAFAADGADATVWADRKELRAVLLNLLGNAVKYSPLGGPVAVRVEAADAGAVRVAVEDWGIGIDPDDLAGLFEPFQRGRNVGAVRGSGLGLAIARRAARAHGGDVEVASEPGQGTTATLTLPRTTAAPDGATEVSR